MGLQRAGVQLMGRFNGLGLRGNDSSPVTLEGLDVSNADLLTEHAQGLDAMLQMVMPWFNIGTVAMAHGLCLATVASTTAHLRGVGFAHSGTPLRDLPMITRPRSMSWRCRSGAGSLGEDQQNVRVINWIKQAASQAKFITSHCQGAILLGKAGLLDNKEATTFTANTEALQTHYPACRVQADRRIMVDGNLVTSPGGLASYEASLYVVEQLFGKNQALSIASALIFGASNVEAALTTK